MQRIATRLAIGAVAALAFLVPADARGLGAAMELEAARANARAGGPLSARDKELLERHGCLSGTNNDFCRRLEGRSPRIHRKGKYRY